MRLHIVTAHNTHNNELLLFSIVTSQNEPDLFRSFILKKSALMLVRVLRETWFFMNPYNLRVNVDCKLCRKCVNSFFLTLTVGPSSQSACGGGIVFVCSEPCRKLLAIASKAFLDGLMLCFGWSASLTCSGFNI